MIRPSNYFVSLDGRVKYAVASTADLRQLEALIAETELAFADAPDPERLREALTQLKQTYTTIAPAAP